MLGFLFAFGSTFLTEISDTIGKKKVAEKAVSKYTVGFLTTVFGILFFVFTAWSLNVFYFSLESLPTFIPRVILEILLGYITVTVLGQADRSTFGFIRVLTIPLLFSVDLLMGYPVVGTQMIGMAIIAGAIVFVSCARGFSKKNLPLLILGSTIAVATLSLYK